jgi:hypothetical protein
VEAEAWVEKALPVSNMEDTRIRPLWRFCHTLNQQKVISGTPLPHEEIKNEDRSDYVYENKWWLDKLSSRNVEYWGGVDANCQKFADFEGRLNANFPVWMRSIKKMRVAGNPSPKRRVASGATAVADLPHRGKNPASALWEMPRGKRRRAAERVRRYLAARNPPHVTRRWGPRE